MNPYHVLEVPIHADLVEIRASYRRLVRVHHPDCAPDEATRAAASARMVEINWAWHIVSDAGRRAVFDARLQVEQIEWARRQQESLRAQRNSQVKRGQQAHLTDVLKAQAQRKQGQNKSLETPATPPLTPKQRARQHKRMEEQTVERERRERAHQVWTRPTRKRLTTQEKKARRQERAQVSRMRREDKKQNSNSSARRQLAEATRLFRQEGRAGEAIALCHDVLRVDFRNVPARELLGDFYLQLGREDRTLSLWEQVLSLQPDNAAVRRKLNSLRPRVPYAHATSPSKAPQTNTETNTATGNNGFWGRVVHAFRSGL